MSQKESNFNNWKVAAVVGLVLIAILFATHDSRTQEERQRDEIEESVRKEMFESKSDNLRQNSNQDAIGDIKKELSKMDMQFYKVEISESHFIWVQIQGNLKDPDKLANTLCIRAKRFSFQGVTIFDASGEELARSICK